MRYLTALAFLIMPFFAFAQDADKIVGIYYVAHQGEESKVNIEALFNTVLRHKELIKGLFKKQ